MAYHVSIIKPGHPRFNILEAYREVAETIHWGFNTLGIKSTMADNYLCPKSTNIIFGWIPLISLGGIDSIPENSILYNLEQYSELDIKLTNLKVASDRFQIWDYNEANIEAWKKAAPAKPPFFAPISYAPTLERISNKTSETIDATFIGSTGPNRNRKIVSIATHVSRPKLLSIQNVWGKERDDYISRSKILLNLSEESPKLKIYEIVRVAYYLANRKIVLSDCRTDTHIEEDIRRIVRWGTEDELGELVDFYCRNTALRKEWADKAYTAFRERSVLSVLKNWLSTRS
jgi:hypothetical protein